MQLGTIQRRMESELRSRSTARCCHLETHIEPTFSAEDWALLALTVKLLGWKHATSALYFAMKGTRESFSQAEQGCRVLLDLSA